MGEPFKLNNGTLLISTEAPGGLYNAAQLKKIAALCDSDAAVAKATEDQRLALFVDPNKANDVVKELRSVGLGVRHYQNGVHQPVSCVGALCPEFKQDALATAMDMTESLRGLSAKSSLKIGINGCGRGCVPTNTLDVSIVGEESGYKVSMAGRNSQIPELASFLAEAVPAGEIAAMVLKLAKSFAEEGNPGESFQELVERMGASPFAEMFAPYSQDAAAADPFGEAQDSANIESVAFEASEDTLENSGETLMGSVDLKSATEVTDDDQMKDIDLTLSDDLEGLDDLSAVSDGVSEMTNVDMDISAEADLSLEMTNEIELESPGEKATDNESPVLAELANADMGSMTTELADVENLSLDEIPDLSMDESAVDENGELSLADTGTSEIADFSMDDLGTAEIAAENIAASQVEPSDIDIELDMSGLEAEPILDDALATAAARPSDSVENSSDDAELMTLTEDQEQVFEMELEESIQEEKVIAESAEVDDAEMDRAEALRLVSSVSTEPEVVPVNASLIPEDDIDLIETVGLDELASDIKDIVQTPQSSVAKISSGSQKFGKGAGFSGIDFNGDNIVVSFNSGMTVEVESSEIAQIEKVFNVAGQKICVARRGELLRITVDGLSINVPTKRAA